MCGNNTCLAPSCGDGVLNGQESDLDCGGPCDSCVAGSKCQINGDCDSKVCLATNVCASASCSDGVRNGNETAVDCGGGCSEACGDGQSCGVDTDCQSRVCVNSTCLAPSCDDGVSNGQESDIDCGGPQCSPCESGQMCGGSDDCASQICNGTMYCQAPTCSDGVKNGGEVDIDCGEGCSHLSFSDDNITLALPKWINSSLLSVDAGGLGSEKVHLNISSSSNASIHVLVGNEPFELNLSGILAQDVMEFKATFHMFNNLSSCYILNQVIKMDTSPPFVTTHTMDENETSLFITFSEEVSLCV